MIISYLEFPPPSSGSQPALFSSLTVADGIFISQPISEPDLKIPVRAGSEAKLCNGNDCISIADNQGNEIVYLELDFSQLYFALGEIGANTVMGITVEQDGSVPVDLTSLIVEAVKSGLTTFTVASLDGIGVTPQFNGGLVFNMPQLNVDEITNDLFIAMLLTSSDEEAIDLISQVTAVSSDTNIISPDSIPPISVSSTSSPLTVSGEVGVKGVQSQDVGVEVYSVSSDEDVKSAMLKGAMVASAISAVFLK